MIVFDGKFLHRKFEVYTVEMQWPHKIRVLTMMDTRKIDSPKVRM